MFVSSLVAKNCYLPNLLIYSKNDNRLEIDYYQLNYRRFSIITLLLKLYELLVCLLQTIHAWLKCSFIVQCMIKST